MIPWPLASIRSSKSIKDGEEVKMSKRTGKAIAHRDLVADVGVDAVRYFFSEKSGDTPILFDMNLALSKSKDNPVYYAQYAHARCHSLLEMGKDFELDDVGESPRFAPRRRYFEATRRFS
jgi:arginyl-tRNA synthetase